MAANESPTAAVTGANGYVGSRIAQFLARQGFRVVELRRDAARAGSDASHRHFALEEPVPDETLADVDLLVHAAWDFRPSSWDEIEATNVAGSIRLLRAARSAGVSRIVMVSTMSSFAGCKSLYGRAKLAVEAETRECQGAVIRPGLVFGHDPGGMVGQLSGLVDRLPIIPIVGSAGTLYCVHSEDLGRLVLELHGRTPNDFREPIIAAAERGFTLRRILSILAEARGRKVRILPVPWRIVWAGLKGAEIAGLRLGMRSDSVVSLVNQNPQPDFEPTRRTGVHFRDLDPETAFS